MITRDETICPFCGSGTRRGCEMEDDMGFCPAEEADHDFDGDQDEEPRNDRT